MILYLITLRCHGCGAESETPAVVREIFTQVAERAFHRRHGKHRRTGGWDRIGDRDYCPRCLPVQSHQGRGAR